MGESLELALQPDASRLTLPAFLADICERHADRTALRFEDRDLGYAELAREVDRVARGLVGAGVAKGARVAVLMANRPEWIVATFAAARVGAVVVPVNTFATPPERDYILRHGDASLLILQRGLLRHDFLGDLMEGHPGLREGEPGRLRIPALPQLRRVFCLGLEERQGGVEPWSALEELGADVPDGLLEEISSEVRPSDDALIIYTSGTTSQPKGVLHMQRAPVIQSYRFAEYMQLTPEDVTYTAQPFFWTAGICHSMGSTLAAGAKLLLQETFRAEEALACIERERATLVVAWPHQDKAMAEHPSARERDLSSARKIEFRSPLAPLVGLEKDEWGIYGSFGMSETFTLATAVPAWAPASVRKTNGVVLPGMSLRLVDPESGEPLPPGEKGEIAVKGVTLMRGYYKVEPEGVLDAEGYFHTQDGGHFDAEGHLHWTGRLSNLIKTGGANVSPLEIEGALKDYPGLQVAAAVGIDHPTLGEVIVLCAAPAPGAELDEAEIRSFLRERLAVYKVPRRVLFFRPDELSYTGTQKVQVAPLREAAQRRLGEEGAEIEGFRYEAPPQAAS